MCTACAYVQQVEVYHNPLMSLWVLSCRTAGESMGMVFQIDAVRKEFNAVSVDKDEALQKRLLRLDRDRCSNYRKKVHNLQIELQHNCTGLGLKDPGRELEAVRFRSRMEAVQVDFLIHIHDSTCIGKHPSFYE